ncbi:hypothetical protein C8F04DRAFT_309083 [Mycena alexandri]|uniref:MYND-type domain-containing protein n=1 Tax=Mycena alexandri TaxID=1745969 RepID=A0AAD6S437_9AGAR|nr:hypothetical protein C8F04DRAFT_309083 [Mycena alexandri]
MPMKMSSPDYYFERISTLCLASDIFLAVGNTGCAVHRRWVADEMFTILPEGLKTSETKRLTPVLGRDIVALRHPDPHTAPSLIVNFPALQMRGSWKKLHIHKSSVLSSRMGSAICAYDGHLYVLGGEKFNEVWFRDFWMLDLEKLDAWRRLPDFPLPKEIMRDLVGYKLAPTPDGRAFLFTGMPAIPVFDMKRRKWDFMPTTFTPDEHAPDWPYPQLRLINYAAHVVGERLYVFGGNHRDSIVGTDLLMELHIPPRRWRRLSGSEVPHPSSSGPGPRMQCHSWVGKDMQRLFFMFGQADRQAAMIHKQAHGAFYSYGYGDLWSWDIKGEKWFRERLHGNVPSPRAEVACTYNEVLDKVIFFGGYSPTVPTWFEPIQDTVTYTYYADTFIGSMNPTASSPPSKRPPISWKQVLTRGFPTYRADSTLVTDSKTGKTFLFGGYKNTTYVPSKNTGPSDSRSFMDLWQLRLDLPGGFFEGVDLEEEARTAKVGPWQRCFACGSTGPWKRCGGSCNGRVFFCDSECLKQGWKEHKEKHRCGKA